MQQTSAIGLLPSTASGARYKRSAKIYGRVEACGSGLLQHRVEFQHSMRLISVEKDWKHVLKTTHNWLFSEPPTFSNNATNLQLDEKVLQITS